MKLPPPNSRIAFIGPTRSGKTFLARQWLMHYKNVIVIDPKRQFSWQRPGEKRFSRKARNMKELINQLNMSRKDGHPIIYQPDLSVLDPDSNYDLDHVYELAFHRENTLVYIDELYFLANGTDFVKRAPWFFRCVVAGASKGIGVWSAYQRPSWVPLVAMTETEVRAIFYLRTRDDRARIDSSFGDMPWQQLRDTQHGFVISTDRWTSPVMRARKKEVIANGSTTDSTAPVSPSSDSAPND